MAVLLGLPMKLLAAIVKLAFRRDLTTIALTCRTFQDVAEERLYRSAALTHRDTVFSFADAITGKDAASYLDLPLLMERVSRRSFSVQVVMILGSGMHGIRDKMEQIFSKISNLHFLYIAMNGTGEAPFSEVAGALSSLSRHPFKLRTLVLATASPLSDVLFHKHAATLQTIVLDEPNRISNVPWNMPSLEHLCLMVGDEDILLTLQAPRLHDLSLSLRHWCTGRVRCLGLYNILTVLLLAYPRDLSEHIGGILEETRANRVRLFFDQGDYEELSNQSRNLRLGYGHLTDVSEYYAVPDNEELSKVDRALLLDLLGFRYSSPSGHRQLMRLDGWRPGMEDRMNLPEYHILQVNGLLSMLLDGVDALNSTKEMDFE